MPGAGCLTQRLLRPAVASEVGGGVLMACLAEQIARDDVAKTTLAAILEQHGIATVRSL